MIFKNPRKLAKYLRYTSRTTLLVVSAFWFVFALFSGAEYHGGGLKGIAMNSPNALPWLLLFVFIFIAFKWQLIGGSLIAIMGLSTMFFFDAFESLFVLVAISLPLLILGVLLVASWYLTKYKDIKIQD